MKTVHGSDENNSFERGESGRHLKPLHETDWCSGEGRVFQANDRRRQARAIAGWQSKVR